MDEFEMIEQTYLDFDEYDAVREEQAEYQAEMDEALIWDI